MAFITLHEYIDEDIEMLWNDTDSYMSYHNISVNTDKIEYISNATLYITSSEEKEGSTIHFSSSECIDVTETQSEVMELIKKAESGK
ncbi:MAG: hypothetical protein NC177_04295 [Ruminococcus flavefaciens]|nr:hypothetical protein [Ruminococcus flavefaciens]